jgi:hypothetical protein
MNYLPFIAYVIITIVIYLYDFNGNGLNKLYYDVSENDYTTFSFVSNVIYGLIIYYTCYIGYEILPWVLTTLTFLSFVSFLFLNLFKIKLDYTKIDE